VTTRPIATTGDFFRKAMRLGTESLKARGFWSTNSWRAVGTYGDYGNPIGQAVIGEALYIALYGKQFALRYGLRLDPAAVPALVAELESNLGIPPSATINQAGIKSFSMGIFDRTFAVTGALNVLTLAVAGFAILMSLLTLATMRVPQLAPAWATGMTRRRIGQLEVIRAIVLALVTAVLALRLGLFAVVAAVLAAAWPARRLATTPPAQLLKVFSNER